MSLLFYIQAGKSLYVILAGAYFKLLLVDVPHAGAWNCVNLQNVCVIGPYSPQWYGFYQLFAIAGYKPEIVAFCILDSLLLLGIARTESFPYMLLASSASFFFLFYDPGDLLIYWLALLSRGHWFLSITAITTKLPIFAPLNVWQYVWTISLPTANPSIPLNPLRYAILLGFMLQPVWERLAHAT